MLLSFAACRDKRQFYTLLEAYNEGLITDADLGAIKAYDGESVTFTEESREMFRAQLLEHFDDLKGTLYYAEGEKDMYSYLKNWLEQKEYYPQILEYYGEYNGVSVLYVEIGFHMFMISEEYCVGEYTFYPWHLSYYLVWTNPEAIEFSLQATT